MTLFEFLKTPRCPLCLKRNKIEELIVAYNDHVKDKEKLFQKREKVIEQEKEFLEEQHQILNERDRAIMQEKERMLDAGSMEIKKNILMPNLKKKWKAEAIKIDAERVKILKETPEVHESLIVRRTELERALDQVKGKPQNTSNHDLLMEYQSRLHEIDKIINIIDEVRRNG